MAAPQLQPGANFAEAAPVFLSEADLLAVLDRVMPEWYLEPLKSPGPGYEWFQALAQALSRVSLAVARADASMFVIYSHGGALSTALVEFFRPTLTAGQFIIKAGTIVRTSRSNRSYQVVADLTMTPGALTVQGLVQSVAPAYEYDVPGPFTTADGTVLPGEIDSVVIPILEPVFAEPSIQVRQLAAATGGKSPVLDQLGLDRNLGRRPGEDDATYKGRIRQLPDTISPAALRRQLDAIFLVMGLEYDLVETWESRYQTCWDTPDGVIVGALTGDVEADVFVYDDTRPGPFRGRWMDEHDHVAGLVLTVPETGSWSERSFAYDDAGTVGPSSTFASNETFDFFEDFFTGNDQPLLLAGEPPWDATISAIFPGDTANAVLVGGLGPAPVGLTLTVSFVSGVAFVEVRDHQRWDTGTAAWVADLTTVGVKVTGQVGSSPVIDLVESRINSTSLLLRVSRPDVASVGINIDPVFIALHRTIILPMVGGVSSDESAFGWRSTSAYDSPTADAVSASSFVRVPFYDGVDLEHQQFYKHISDLMRQIKGGGTNVAIELKGQ